jgi:ABC-type antimicrobial peptide transport system permease subunit
MLKNYFKTAWRNLKKGQLYSFINISGLAIGMAVTLIIGMWVWDELSFDKHFKNYDRIGQVWQFVKFDVEKASYNSLPVPLAEELETKYPDFEKACVTTYNRSTIIGTDEKKILKTGMYTEPELPGMLTLKMLAGSKDALKDMNSILLSESLSKILFGKENPVNKTIRLNNKTNVQVAGVYEDLPDNTSFKDVFFLASWQLFMSMEGYARFASTQWDENSFQIFVQLKEGADFNKVSSTIRDIRMKREDPPAYKPEFFIHPMSKWHLHGDFANGVNIGGLIQHVKLFGIAGIFVLLLACINFMNLSTARSEKRAKEVGIRKTIGSVRSQLVYQFFSESILVSFVAFLLCLLLAQLALPFFNEVAGKKMTIPWTNLYFWLIAMGFCLITGLIAGSYPALYLSSFQPIKVLKGTFRAGRLASWPRKATVVFQFAVSITLIIGAIVVYRQIMFAKDRPAGYNSDRLIEVNMMTPEIKKNFEVLRTELLNSGYVKNIARSMGSVTEDYGGTTRVSWKGKAPETKPLLISNRVTHDYGKTLGWKLLAGRDFSESIATDSLAVIINQSAMQLMGFKDALNETIDWGGKDYRVIGVVGDMIKFSPFDNVKPSFFTISAPATNIINIRIASGAPLSTALAKMEAIFKKHNPAAPFEFKFVDEQYATKFANEVKIGKLAGFFATLAIFISCLGLFGLASFVAGQRTKEIGVRKVLGATVLNVWKLLSKDFVVLVIIAMLIATPVAWYFMSGWLENYRYRISISWWIFVLTGCGALVLTLVMVSYQAIKAALKNPVKTLRTE